MRNLNRIILFTLLFGFLTSCASYKPLVDTAGRSGTFDEDKAKEISNDLQHCKQMAEDNTNITQYEDIYRKCMINRGHSVLN